MHFLTKQTLENTEVAIIRQRQTKQRHATICVRPHYKPPSTQKRKYDTNSPTNNWK